MDCVTIKDESQDVPQELEMFDDFDLGPREFHVLDKFEAADKEGGEESDSSSYNEDVDSDSEAEIHEDEIDAMLDEGLNGESQARKKQKRNDGSAQDNSESLSYEEREKIVLEEKGKNHFEVLPENWVQVTHNSGMPIYLHKPTRVCTLAKPYFLGPGSARKHAVPISAIPCLHYSKALDKDKDEEQQSNDLATSSAAQEGGGAAAAAAATDIPCARIESVQENQAAHSLNGIQLREYCSKLFHFKTVRLMRFKTWAARRKHTKLRKQRQTFPMCPAMGVEDENGEEDGEQCEGIGRPTLPNGTNLITVPIGGHSHGLVTQEVASPAESQGSSTAAASSGSRREWIMNPAGKSYVCILHEYVQHALKKQPCYQFKEIENAATPYSATVLINGMQYGTGVGSSKKAAKAEAAKATLQVLIPQMKEKIINDSDPCQKGPTHQSDLDLSVESCYSSHYS